MFFEQNRNSSDVYNVWVDNTRIDLLGWISYSFDEPYWLPREGDRRINLKILNSVVVQIDALRNVLKSN